MSELTLLGTGMITVFGAEDFDCVTQPYLEATLVSTAETGPAFEDLAKLAKSMPPGDHRVWYWTWMHSDGTPADVSRDASGWSITPTPG